MKRLKLTNEDIGTLCQSLAYLLHAGSSAGDALALLAEDTEGSPLGEKLGAMAALADGGSDLAACFRQAECFPAYLCGLLETGEQSGRTEEALTALSRYYAERARTEKRLRNALLYPAVLLLVMLAVLVVLLVWVLPVFNEVYAQLGSSLHGLAGGLLELGMLLRQIMPLLCALLALFVLLMILFGASDTLRNRLLAFWRRKHADRGIGRMTHSAHFVQALSMAMCSGFTPENAARLAMMLTEDTAAFHDRCLSCLTALENGASLPRALGDAEILQRSDCRLLEAGIRGGNGESAMVQIAERLEEESAQALERRVGRIEPTLVVVISVLVGVILLAVMLPLMHIMSTIG